MSKLELQVLAFRQASCSVWLIEPLSFILQPSNFEDLSTFELNAFKD